MIREELTSVIEHNQEILNDAVKAEGAMFLNEIAANPDDPRHSTLVAMAARIANDGDLLVPVGISDVTAEVLGTYAERTFTLRRPWGDGVQEVFEYE